MSIPEKSAAVASAVTVAATGFAVGARAADGPAGLVLDRRHPRAEPVAGAFMRVIDMWPGPVAASGA